MSRVIQRAEFFKLDFARQFAWYAREAGPDVARRFQVALDQTLNQIGSRPDLGRLRHFRNPRLQGVRSLPVERPFNKMLVFYRVGGDVLHAVRLMHGARDLPLRLAEPPVAHVD
jgi:plasmid stabilization system protein ParE